METRKVALIVPFNENCEVILQRRKGFINKPTDKDYGFFGGHLEQGESVEQALKREVKEELTLDLKDIKSLRFFKKYKYILIEGNVSVELSVYLCDMEDVKNMDVKEGKEIKLKIKEAINSNISEMDKIILKEIFKQININ